MLISLKPFFPAIPRNIISCSTALITWMPPFVRKTLVGAITRQPDPSLSVTADQLLNRTVVNNALYMAGQEMATIQALDYDFYNAHVDKFIIYFSPGDNWAPKNHYDDMKNRFPHGKYPVLIILN